MGHIETICVSYIGTICEYVCHIDVVVAVVIGVVVVVVTSV